MNGGGGCGKEVGGGVGKWGHASFHFIMPVKGVVAGVAAAILAGLQPLQGTWSLDLSFIEFFVSYTMIPKEEEKEKETLWHKRRGESCERDNDAISCVASPIVLPILSSQEFKNRILDTDSFDFSNADVVWKYDRKHFERVLSFLRSI